MKPHSGLPADEHADPPPLGLIGAPFSILDRRSRQLVAVICGTVLRPLFCLRLKPVAVVPPPQLCPVSLDYVVVVEEQ